MATANSASFRPVGFWAPRSAVNVALRPRLWRNIRHAPVSVRFDESEWSRFPAIVRWSYSPDANEGRLCLTFTSVDTYSSLAYRWRAVANALWRMIRARPGIAFHEIPVDIGDGCDESVPTNTFRFARMPRDPHDLIPNSYFLDRRHRLPPPMPWEGKKDTVYFRGSLTGLNQGRENARVAACLVSREITDSDCKLTSFPKASVDFETEVQLEGIVGSVDPVNTLNNHRYLLDIDGNSSSWHRFWLIGMFRGVPIRFETRWQECWHDMIRDGEHYVSANRHNLATVVEELRSQPEKARQIAESAAAIARGPLSSEGAQHMFEKAWLRRVVAHGWAS